MASRKQPSLKAFPEHTGDYQLFPESSYLDILADKFQVRLVLLAAGYLIFGLVQYSVFNNVIIYQSVQHELRHPTSIVGPSSTENLPDVFHDLLQPLGLRDDSTFFQIVDTTPYALFVLGVAYMFFKGETRRFVYMCGTLMFLLMMNSIVGNVTIQPDAHLGGTKRCFEKNGYDPKHDSHLGLWIFNIARGSQGCNDMMWSGHTKVSIFGVMVFDKSISQREGGGVLSVIVRVFLWVSLATFCVALIAVRAHYTADVFVSALLCIGFFHHKPFHEFVWRVSCYLVGLRGSTKESETLLP